jgi:hypothetical protein
MSPKGADLPCSDYLDLRLVTVQEHRTFKRSVGRIAGVVWVRPRTLNLRAERSSGTPVLTGLLYAPFTAKLSFSACNPHIRLGIPLRFMWIGMIRIMLAVSNCGLASTPDTTLNAPRMRHP